MKALKLSNQAKVAILEKNEDFFNHYYNPLADEITNTSTFLQEVDDIDMIIDIITSRFIEIVSNQFQDVIDFKSVYYDLDSIKSKYKDKVYNLTEAARDMRVSEKFLRKGLRIGYFFGKKQNGKWRIGHIDHINNGSLLRHL